MIKCSIVLKGVHVRTLLHLKSFYKNPLTFHHMEGVKREYRERQNPKMEVMYEDQTGGRTGWYYE